VESPSFFYIHILDSNNKNISLLRMREYPGSSSANNLMITKKILYDIHNTIHMRGWQLVSLWGKIGRDCFMEGGFDEKDVISRVRLF
jgi:hypothetical protein